MKRALVLGLVAAMLLPAIAEARGSRKGGSGLNQHDTSQDFGKHFDELVRVALREDAELPSSLVSGMELKVDPDVPADEARLYQRGRRVGTIVNVGYQTSTG